ncbi:MAG: hypothetical protein ABSC77_04840 [Terracidiphilus sp.]|jgi:hypothetical protein
MLKVASRIILTIFVLGALLEALGMTWKVGEPRELDYGEGIVIWQASQVFDLKSAFHPLEQYPHIVFHYTPVYHVAVRMLSGLLGDPFLSGRIISLLAAFWIVGLFAWIVLRATRGYASAGIRWFSAVLICACALMVPSMQWVPLARVDMLALAFQFTGLSVIAVMPFRLRNQIAAFCLLFLGLYTKQSLLAIPVASVLLIGLIRPARAIRLFCGFMAAGLGVLLLLAWFTHGGVIKHWFAYNVNPFHLNNGLFAELGASRNLAVLIAAGLGAFWLTFPGANRNKWRNWRASVSARLMGSPLRRTGAGFGLAAVLGFVTSWGIGKEGSNINYCLDWQLALCPLTGVFVVLLSRSWTARDRGMAFLRPLLLLLAGVTGLQFGVQAAHEFNNSIGLTASAHQRLQEARREDAELARLISSFPGPVVSENMTALLRAGKSIPFEPAIIKQTTDTGVFDETALVKRTSDRFFDAFVLTTDTYSYRFSPRMLQAIHENYRPYTFSGSDYLVYVRR